MERADDNDATVKEYSTGAYNDILQLGFIYNFHCAITLLNHLSNTKSLFYSMNISDATYTLRRTIYILKYLLS